MSENGRIKKVLSAVNRGEDLIGEVLLEDGTIATYRVGGDVKVYHDKAHDKIKIHVRWKSVDKLDN